MFCERLDSSLKESLTPNLNLYDTVKVPLTSEKSVSGNITVTTSLSVVTFPIRCFGGFEWIVTLKNTGVIVGGAGSVIVSFRSLFSSKDTFGFGGDAER